MTNPALNAHPLPWRVERSAMGVIFLVSANGKRIGESYSEEAARLIVDSVNGREERRTALEALTDAADAHIADQSRAPSPSCGLTQPITAAEGEALCVAYRTARALIEREATPADRGD